MKQPPKGEIVLCFPGAQHWELWTSDGAGGLVHEPSEKTEASSPDEFKGVTHHAFPISAVTCSPFWAASEDDSLLPDLVEMRLETQNLRPDSGMGRHFDFCLLDRDHHRSLLQPIVLPDNRPIPLSKGEFEMFDITPNYLPLPRNHLVLWRELGKWVTVATRNGRPVYFQGLTAPTIDEDAVLELKCFLLQLHSQGLIEELSGIVVWGDPLPEANRLQLEQELEMSVLSEERPHPLLPEQPLDLLPKQVAYAREVAARRERIRNWVALGALVYLAVISTFAALYFLQWRNQKALAAEVDQLQRQFNWVNPASARWRDLEDAWNVDRYPLELLLRVINEMPESGVALLDVDISEDRVLLKGEASNIQSARKFTNDVKNSNQLKDYDWEDPPPKLDKTGIATFEVIGKYRYGSA